MSSERHEEPLEEESPEESPEEQEHFCEYCGWCSAYVESHVEYSVHASGGCKEMQSEYDIGVDADGELVWALKQKGITAKSDGVIYFLH